jgi:hypothetical protein
MNSPTEEKIQFGIDFLIIMRTLELMAQDINTTNKVTFADSAAKLFMVFWDFSIPEIEETNKRFLQKMKMNCLDKPTNAIMRISNFIKDDPYLVDMFVVQLAAMGLMDMDLSQNELVFVGCLKKFSV